MNIPCEQLGICNLKHKCKSCQNVNPTTIYGAWYYIYGKGSHMNLAGKLLIGVPMFPLVCVFVFVWNILDFLFTKQQKVNK